jgi:hypothetical protein
MSGIEVDGLLSPALSSRGEGESKRRMAIRYPLLTTPARLTYMPATLRRIAAPQPQHLNMQQRI